MKRVLGGLRWFLVTVAIIVLTSFTIDATTSYSPSQSALGILAHEVTETVCPEGMAEVLVQDKRLCVDLYEVSAGEMCPHQNIRLTVHTQENIDTVSCQGVSVKDAVPWTYVTLHQAREICARSSKRLATHREWYRGALGVVDSESTPVCNVHSNASEKTGTSEQCVSGSGSYDMIGNVWEWIDGLVEEGSYQGRVVPVSGYVRAVDGDGVATETSDQVNNEYHQDYFWSKEEGIYGMMRGGFYGSGSDAGVYSIQATVDPGFSGAAVGFRCVKDL